jgi:hypothetical protein
MNNCYKILTHMVQVGSISPLEALMVHRVVRLAPRIHELRGFGLDIATTARVDTAGTKYTRYVLGGTLRNRALCHTLLEHTYV